MLVSTLVISALFVLAAVLALWLLAIRVRDVSIIDMAYGLLIDAVALIAFLRADAHGALQWLAMIAIGLWTARFTVYIVRRNWGRGEDPRYTRLRAWAGSEGAFNRLALKIVFLHQGVVIFLITLPLQLIMSASPAAIGVLGALGALLWAAGFLVEALADAQLARFRADPANRGRILDTGLWRYSRHPNYFGDACLHWGIWLMACALPWGWATVAGPLAITYYLVNVTGMRTLEKKMLKEKPAYADYVRRTSGFVPWWPRAES